jgi:hypothetical protein
MKREKHKYKHACAGKRAHACTETHTRKHMHKNSPNKLTTTAQKLEFEHSFCHMVLKRKEKQSQLKCDYGISGNVQPQTDERKCEDNRANREIHVYCEKENVNSHDPNI